MVSVHPDGILTDMTNNMEGTFPEMEPHQAMKAFGFACEPEAVADVIAFLASDDARHINGAGIRVDNTSTIHAPYW
jgi:3(or 17)beta-hydroxysteroid dehydrogenase